MMEELLFSIKTGFFIKETLNLYEKLRNNPNNYKPAIPSTCLYRYYVNKSLEELKIKFEKTRIITMYDDKSYPDLKKDYKFPQVIIVLYRTKSENLIFFRNKYFFLKRPVVINHYTLFNYTFVEIDFQEFTNIDWEIKEKLIDENILNENSLIFRKDKKILTYNFDFLSNNMMVETKRLNQFKEDKYKIYNRFLKGKLQIFNISPEQKEQILNLVIFNYNKNTSFKYKSETCLLTQYECFEKIKKILNIDIENIYPKCNFPKTELVEWIKQTETRSYDCCDETFDYSGGATWLKFSKYLRNGLIPFYMENQYKKFIEVFDKAVSPPEGTYMFRGLLIKKGEELKTLDKSFSSFSTNLEHSLQYSSSFSKLGRDNDYQKIMLFYKVKKDDNIKCFFVSGKYVGFGYNYDVLGEAEFILKNNSNLTIEERFIFGDTKFMEIIKIDFLESEVKIDHDDKFGIIDIIKHKYCFLSNGNRNKKYNFYCPNKIFSPEETIRLELFENDFSNLGMKFIDYEKEYFPYYSNIYNYLTEENFFIIKIKNEDVKKYLSTNKSNNCKDFLNFIIKYHV